MDRKGKVHISYKIADEKVRVGLLKEHPEKPYKAVIEARII